MKNILAIGLACALPAGLAAGETEATQPWLGTATVLVIEDAPASTTSLACLHGGDAKDDCMTLNRAVLAARTRNVPALRERGRWI
jgi:hypothetical protein